MDGEQVDMEKKKSDWESFIRKAKTKTANHTTMVRFYNAVYNIMILTVILLAGVLTCIILLGGIHKTVLASLSGACTILTAMSKFLIADRKKAGHKRFAKIFQSLLIRMLKCEGVEEYNSMWSELQENIIKSPLVLIWQRKSKKTKLAYNMSHRLQQAFLGKEEPEANRMQSGQMDHTQRQGYYRVEQGNNGAHQGYQGTHSGYNSTQQGNPNNQHTYSHAYRPNSFNPHDFHVMSIQDPAATGNQQTPSRNDGYVAISGLHENESRPNNNQQEHIGVEQLSDEKSTFLTTPSKGKKKRKKTESERARQSYSSQGTLDEIDEEEEREEHLEWDTSENGHGITSDSTALTKQKKSKKKKGQNNQSKKSSIDDDLPPPPAIEEEDEEEYDNQQQQRMQGKLNGSGASSARGLRSSATVKNNRPIVYDEEEENDLSEDTDELDGIN